MSECSCVCARVLNGYIMSRVNSRRRVRAVKPRENCRPSPDEERSIYRNLLISLPSVIYVLNAIAREVSGASGVPH